MSVLAIDAGSTNCKAGVFTEEGLVSTAGSAYPGIGEGGNFSSFDAEAAWGMIKSIIAKAVAGAKGRAGRIKALAVSSMGEAFAPATLDRRIVGRCMLAIDTRGAEHAERLEREIGQNEFFRINRNAIGPYYTFAKLMWLREHESKVYAAADKFLLWGDFVGFMLGGEPYATNSLANRTLLFDIGKNDWSDRMLSWSGIEREKLGRIVPSGVKVGTVPPALAAELGLEGEVDVVAGGHDQCCNSLGCGCVRPGLSAAGLGTYETYCPAFAWPEDADRMREFGLNMEHHVLPDLYVSFLYHHSGLLLEWFRRVFAVADKPPAGKSVFDVLGAEMPDGPTNLLVLPYHEPPQWPKFVGDASGAVIGLKTATTRGEVYKALLEGITYYFVEHLTALESLGMMPDEFLASGGGSKSDAWLQMKADILGVPFARLRLNEGSLGGAAMIAGVHSGLFASAEEAVGRWVAKERVFEPNPARQAVYREKAAMYHRLLPSLRPLLRDMSAQ